MTQSDDELRPAQGANTGNSDDPQVPGTLEPELFGPPSSLGSSSSSATGSVAGQNGNSPSHGTDGSADTTTGRMRKIRLSQGAISHTLGAGYTGAMRPVSPEHVAHKVRSANPLGHDISLPRFRQTNFDPSSIIPTGTVPSQRTRVTPPIVDNLMSNTQLLLDLQIDDSASGSQDGAPASFDQPDQHDPGTTADSGMDIFGQTDAYQQEVLGLELGDENPGAFADLGVSDDLTVPTFDEILTIHEGGVPVPVSSERIRRDTEAFEAAEQSHARLAQSSRGASGDGRNAEDSFRDDSASDVVRRGDPSESGSVEGDGDDDVPFPEAVASESTDFRAKDATAPEDDGAEDSSTDASSSEELGKKIGGSALVISVCVMLSRITGFIRTWAMGFAMGTTLLSSSYQVACNLPNQLYELVMGGMLVTAFLPVYVSLQKREGQERASEYASTLLGIVVVILGAASLLCTIFAPQVVYTQMFLSNSGDRDLVTYFFRFFAIQLLLYGISAILGGLLNAERDYVWSSAAPIANNLVVITVMIAYVFVSPAHPDTALTIIAIGTPVGVLTQTLILVPPILRSKIRLRPHINIHDPALRETLSLGLATIVVTACSFVTVSVQNSAAMAVSDAGSSILYYARQWFTLPYAFLSVPLTTTLFTELSDMAADNDRDSMRKTIVMGSRQSLFFMIPFALYLMVFSVPLVSLFCAGEFTEQSVQMVATYLRWMAVSLPFYGLFMFMQKVFSAIRRMRFYAIVNVVASVIQVIFTLLLPLGIGNWQGIGINGIAIAQTMFFAFGDVGCYIYLRSYFGKIGMRSILRCAGTSLALGGAGAAVGALILWLLTLAFGSIGTSIVKALIYVIVAGIPTLIVTYGLSIALHAPESRFLSQVLGRFTPQRLRRQGR
jgi:putative peptidoglycan lipid II flippase